MYVRNEESYLPRCIEYLSTQGVKVVVLDNESTDATADICRSYAPELVIRYQVHPFQGAFDLTSITQMLEAMQKTIEADWFVLNSPDEVLQSDRPGERMADALRRFESQGYNVINFEEFVFMPENESVSYIGKDYLQEMRHYYYFAPFQLRSMRAWKNPPGFHNPEGHRVEGPGIQLYPDSFIHRQYITLSREHFRRKYEKRIFSPVDIAKGWHRRRINIDFDKSMFPPARQLKLLPNGEPAGEFDRSDPWADHFWCLGQSE
ncbi:glycosyltransferase family 2 protein [Pseudomonadota bacterium]